MPFMRETAWAVCYGEPNNVGTVIKTCGWAESGPNSWHAAVSHEEQSPGHTVEVGTR